MRTIRVNECGHPMSLHKAKGMCKSCYEKSRYGLPEERRRVSTKNRRNNLTRNHREREYRRTYGITIDLYNELLSSQAGKCAVRSCNVTEFDNRNGVLFVDHDHISGKIRGLLCSNHNLLLGKLGDSVSGVLELIEYLVPERFEAIRELLES